MKIEVRRDSRLRSSKVSKDGNTMEDDRIEVVSVYHELREETEDNIDYDYFDYSLFPAYDNDEPGKYESMFNV